MLHSFRGTLPNVHSSVFQAPGSQIIGDVEIGAEASVWFNAVIRGDVNSVRIGAGTNVQDGAVLHVTFERASLTIGRDVTIGHMAVIHGCTIGDRCLIGMGAILMDGAVIADECVVGAGALVTQGFKAPPRSMIVGSPAKVVRPLKDEELDFLKKSAENYKQYVRWYREGDRIHGHDERPS